MVIQKSKDSDSECDPLNKDDIQVPSLKNKRPHISSSESEDESKLVVKSQAAVKQKNVKTEDDNTPLPDPYPLPKHYPSDIETGSQNKELSYRRKQQFYTDVASSMLRYKRYPSKDDYIAVGRSIIAKYPFLKVPCGKPYVSHKISRLSWLKALSCMNSTLQEVAVETLMQRIKDFQRDKKPRNPTSTTASSTSTTVPQKGKSPGITKRLTFRYRYRGKTTQALNVTHMPCKLSSEKMIVATILN